MARFPVSQISTASGAVQLLLLCCLLVPVSVSAQTEMSREQVETSLGQLKADIQSLQKSLENTRERFRTEQLQLREVDLAIQASVLELRDLEAQRLSLEESLAKLENDRTAYLESLSARKTFLNDQIVAAYQLGRESRLKLLLNQDDPARVSRMLAYYNFFSDAQVEQIQELRTALATLDLMQADIDTRLLALNTLQQQAEQSLTTLQERRRDRATVLSGIEAQISSEQGRLQELTRDREDLEKLLQRLTSALADLPAHIPSDMGEYLSPAQQRGQLPRPVAGKIRHAYGQSRAGGMNWTGWLIEAETGAEIRAIAYGRVAYADWLRGYGLLIIIDHGDGFMSLYGNNESLLFEVGEWVQPGAVISTAGDTPGLEQGLYFELRKEGKAVDPAAWLVRK